MKKIIACFVAVVTLLMLLPINSFANAAVPSSNSRSLSNEISQKDAVIKAYFSGNRSIISDQNASRFIPSNALLLDQFVYLNNIVYLDYSIGGNRYIVEYFKNGNVRKTILNNSSKLIYEASTLNENPTTYSIEANVNEYQLSPDEIENRMQYMRDSGWNPLAPYPILETSTPTRASGSKLVDPLSYTSDNSTRPFVANTDRTGTATIPALSTYGYDQYQPYTVYKTMAYHVEDKLTTKSFSVGTTIASIALSFSVKAESVSKWLNAAGVVSDVFGCIAEQCSIIQKHGYTYSGFKEFGIYDPTRFKKMIEVNSEWGNGHITLGWDYVGEYCNPHWIHDVRSRGLDYSSDALISTGINAYNLNISQYGYWKWEAGNFGS